VELPLLHCGNVTKVTLTIQTNIRPYVKSELILKGVLLTL
jgi:hypothetical protein